MTDDPLLTTSELAAYLKRPVSWIWANAERYRIPRVMLGRRPLYRKSDVDAWLDSLRVGSA